MIEFLIWITVSILIISAAMQIANNDKCYREGVTARKMGANFSRNPYKRYSTSWIHWYAGWRNNPATKR